MPQRILSQYYKCSKKIDVPQAQTMPHVRLPRMNGVNISGHLPSQVRESQNPGRARKDEMIREIRSCRRAVSDAALCQVNKNPQGHRHPTAGGEGKDKMAESRFSFLPRGPGKTNGTVKANSVAAEHRAWRPWRPGRAVLFGPPVRY